MFKYTPPWQALCNSMEHDIKRLSFSPPEDSDVLTQVFRSHQLSAPEISQQSVQEAATPRTSMESTPRRWVIQALSPRLEPTDHRSMLSPAAGDPHGLDHAWGYGKSGDSTAFGFDSISISRLEPSVVYSPQHKEESGDVVVQAKQVTVSEEGRGSDDDWEPSSPGSPTSSAGSNCGFYSFVDDPSSPEAELNEAWMVSPERKVKLATLREEDAFKLQTYSKGRKPESLFQESNDESRYQVNENGAQVVEQWEERQLRKEIILGQAPKQNANFRKQWNALESLDLGNSPNKLVDGFSICYKPSSAKTQATPTAEPGTVDDKQIDFSSAREQFLKMEQATPLHCPSSPKLLRKFQLEDSEVSSTTMKKDKDSSERLSQSPTFLKQEENEKSLTGRKVTVCRTDEKVTKSGVYDVLDSGLGDLLVDTSGGYGSDSVLSNENMSESRDARLTSGYETPIEREIRISQEREESLRRSRGIAHSDVWGEMVEIKTSLLSQSTPPVTPVTPVTPIKAKNRVSFLIQREIEKDSRRDDDRLSQGKAPGLNACGPLQELEDRKRFFEQADKSETEIDKTTTADKTLKERLGSGVGGGSGSSGFPSPCCPHRHPEETELYLIQRSTSPISSTPCGPGVQDLNKALPSRSPEESVKLKDNESVVSHNPLVTVVDRATSTSEITNGPLTSSEGTESIQTRGSSRKVASSSWSPVFSSPSSPVPTDSALLTSQPGGKAFEPWRRHLDSNGLQPWRGSYENPGVIQREIQQDLKREQELQELRESRARLSPLEGSLDSTGQDVTDASHLQSFPRSLVEQEESVYPESPGLPVEQTSKMMGNRHYSPITLSSKLDKTNMSPVSPFPRLPGRLPCLSMVTAQPWASPRPTSPVVSKAAGQGAEAGGTPTQKGLTETLLDDFEERRIKLKREEGSYAGIQPIDDVNSEVLEATRVIRRKSKYALRWEAGLSADLASSTDSS